MKNKTTTGATVTVTLELHDLGSWGPECNLRQVLEQATEAALNRVRSRFSHGEATLIGVPVIKSITTVSEAK